MSVIKVSCFNESSSQGRIDGQHLPTSIHRATTSCVAAQNQRALRVERNHPGRFSVRIGCGPDRLLCPFDSVPIAMTPTALPLLSSIGEPDCPGLVGSISSPPYRSILSSTHCFWSVIIQPAPLFAFAIGKTVRSSTSASYASLPLAIPGRRDNLILRCHLSDRRKGTHTRRQVSRPDRLAGSRMFSLRCRKQRAPAAHAGDNAPR
jgi:hypothetical protein